jgi:hypothetical protein
MLTSLALVAALTAPQQTAYTSTNPIQVAACDAAPATASSAAGFPGLQTPQAGSISIAFVNQGEKTVKSVTFNVNGAQIVDAGTFSSGVTVKHDFIAPGLVSPDVTCAVQSVAFIDGSVWQAQ